MGLLTRMFGGATQAPPASPPRSSQFPGDSKFGERDAQANTRRELVRMLTRDTLRACGIPERWVEAQILLEPARNGQTYIHLHLVLKQWDERMLKFGLAFQRKLRAELERIEPGAREWLLSVAWQYDVGDQCPYLKMPEPSVWAQPDPGNALDREEQEMQADLARLFAVRDAHLADTPKAPK